MSTAEDTTGTKSAVEAVATYAGKHPSEPVALPELVDAIAAGAHTSVHIAKRAIFRALDSGAAHFTPDFKVEFSK